MGNMKRQAHMKQFLNGPFAAATLIWLAASLAASAAEPFEIVAWESTGPIDQAVPPTPRMLQKSSMKSIHPSLANP